MNCLRQRGEDLRRPSRRLEGQESSGLIVGPRRYLFSGLLKCAECGGSITLVSGRSQWCRSLRLLAPSSTRRHGMLKFKKVETVGDGIN